MDTDMKIKKLRKKMNEYGLSAYIIPSGDPHMSEYVADCWKSRSWLSGFTGSAGTLVVTIHESGLWTDGRYFIQAEEQIKGSEIKLFKDGLPNVPTYGEWIAGVLDKGDSVGVSGKLISISLYNEIKKRLSRKGIIIKYDLDLVDEIWEDRPEIPMNPVFNHDVSYAGLSAREKVDKVRDEIHKAGANYYLISSLDDIAWLYNIRGSDVPYVPVGICYAIISPTGSYLFIDKNKLPDDVRKVLYDNGVNIKDYENVEGKLSTLKKGDTIAFDPKRTSCWLYHSISPESEKLEIDEITSKLKAVKSEIELKNIRNCLIKDGVAMVRFLIWLDQNVGKQRITELDMSEMLKYFRGSQDKNMGSSFSSIIGYRKHGAMMHYIPTVQTQYEIENSGMVVIDSGGQYLDGTTDITRTVVFDEVSEEEKRDFTLVLKAHISLARAKFLSGASGSNLDIMARMTLWELGIDYKCGTGHGVGYFLSVHEGPQRFSQIPNSVKLEKGMIITNEPGIYKEGKHGVRTENMLLVIEDEKTDFGQFMKFEVISYCPIDLRGVDEKLLTETERLWLNEYHKNVFEVLAPQLTDEEKDWMREKTCSI